MEAEREHIAGPSGRSTRLSLSGRIIVARDIAHAKLQERIDKGQGLPQYMKDHVVYYGELG